jgi:hypothetical protein
MNRQLACYCGASFEHEFPDQADLDDRTLLDSVLEGEFLALDCPECGKHLKPEYPVRLIGHSIGADLFFVPELDRGGLHRGDLPYPVPEAERIVVGYPELVEKLRIHLAGLEDQAVEVIKYHLLSRAVENEETQERDPRVAFHGVEGDRLVFHIEGLSAQGIAVSRVARETYEKARARLGELIQEEPFSEFLAPPHVSVSRLVGGRL